MTKHFMRSPHWMMICHLICLSVLPAQEKETAIPDYKIAHEKLIALGLPALPASAKWVTVPNQNEYYGSRMEIKTKGNAWLFSNVENTETYTLTWGGLTANKIPKESAAKFQSAKLPNLPEDVAQFQKSLTTLKKNDPSQLRGMIEYGSGSSQFSKMLIFAAQLRQVGQADAANALTHEIMNLSPAQADKIIDATIAQIADSQYDAIVNQFAKDHNWTTYHESLRTLLASFPRGWDKREAVALCLEPAAQRARGVQPAALAITDPKLLALANELLLPPSKKAAAEDELTFHGVDLRQYPENVRARVKQQILMAIEQGHEIGSGGESDTFQSLWLLSEIEVKDDSNAITRFQSMGLAALPALAAMVEDPTLTHILNESGGGGGYDSYFNGSSDNDALQIYQSLKRPMTRGEIAVRLLSLTLPDSNSNLSSIPPADLATIALNFWKKYKDGKKWDMVNAFFAGDQDQQRAAISALSESDDPAAHALLEKNILTVASPIEHFNTILEYLRKNPKANPAFIEEYKKTIIAASTAKNDDRHSYFDSDEERKAHFDGMIKKIEVLTNKQTPQDIITEILKGDPKNAETAIESLMEILANEPATEALILLLTNAINAKEASVTIAFLHGISQLEFEYEDELRPIDDAERALWKTLMDDKRTHQPADEEDEENEGENQTATVGETAATIFYYSAAGEAYHQVQRWAPVLKVSAKELIQSHAKLLVEGKPIPPWPNAEKVSADRMKEIVKSIDGKTPQEILTFIKTLTPDETAAWMEWIVDAGDIPHPDTLKQMRRAIVARSTSAENYFKDDPKVDGLETGFHFTTESLLKWAEELSKNMEQKSRATIWIHVNQESQLGLHVASAQIALPAAKKDDDDEKGMQEIHKMQSLLNGAISQIDEDEATTAVMVLKVQKGRSGLTVTWRLADGKVVRDEKFTPEDLTEILAVGDGADEQRFSIQLQILNRKDFEKIQELME